MHGRSLTDELIKDRLGFVFALQVEKGYATARGLGKKVGRSPSSCLNTLEQLRRSHLIRPLERRRVSGRSRGRRVESSISAKFTLTEKGRRTLVVALTGGVFDIIHRGHLRTLNSARRLGDVLAVVVARDKTVEGIKGRPPLNDERTRLEVIRGLKSVDAAILGDEKDMYDVVGRVKPDIIALSYDQRHSREEISRKVRELGLDTRVVRLRVRIPGIKTSNILPHLVGPDAEVSRGSPNPS